MNPGGVTLEDLETGEVFSSTATDTGVEFVQAVVNHDGTEVTVERALEYGDDATFHIVRSELITFGREGGGLVEGEPTGGDVRLLPIYSNGGTVLTTLAARDGLIDLNVDSTGQWFLATPHEMPLRGYSEAADEQEIPGSYVAADW